MWRIWLLGAVQGLTEFLPVSSSGHLVVLKYWFDVQSPGASLEIVLHMGTLIAVLVGYRRDIKEWTTGMRRGHRQAWRLLWLVAIATVPAAIIGYGFEATVGQYFIPSAVIAGWLLTSVLLWLTPAPGQRDIRNIHDLSGWEAMAIGCMQALALWPGLSRSGSTIFMGRVLRLSPDDAARLSFYMAVPIIAGAFGLTWLRHPGVMSGASFTVSGMIISAIAGLIAIKWVKHTLDRSGAWRRFGLYTFGMALLTWWLGG